MFKSIRKIMRAAVKRPLTFSRQKGAIALAPKKLRQSLPSAPRSSSAKSSSSGKRDTSLFPHLRRIALLETVVFLSVAVVLNIFFGDGTRFIAMPLHPFWIIVLVITVQYGPTEALVTALLASAFLLVGNLPEQSMAETMYEYVLRVSFSPFLWIVTALVLGSIRARQLDERKHLQEQLWKSEEAAAAIVDNYKTMKQSKERLELRLAEERCSVLTIYEIAKSLETLDSTQALAGVEKLVRAALNPKKFSLFRWTNNVLALEAAYGWETPDAYTARFNANTALVRQLVKKNRPLSIVKQDEEKILGGQGMLAGPIIDERTGEAVGMLKIEEIGFMDLGVRTHEIFRVVCAWIARVYVNINTYENAIQKYPPLPVKSEKILRRSSQARLAKTNFNEPAPPAESVAVQE